MGPLVGYSSTATPSFDPRRHLKCASTNTVGSEACSRLRIPTNTVGRNDGACTVNPAAASQRRSWANRSQGSGSDNPNSLQQHHRPACQRRLVYVTMPAFGWSRGVPHLPMRCWRTRSVTASTNTTQTKTCTFLRFGGCSIPGLSIAQDVDNGHQMSVITTHQRVQSTAVNLAMPMPAPATPDCRAVRQRSDHGGDIAGSSMSGNEEQQPEENAPNSARKPTRPPACRGNPMRLNRGHMLAHPIVVTAWLPTRPNM